MKLFLKKLWHFLLAPPTWFCLLSTFLMVACCGGALAAVFTQNTEEIWAYALYALAAISLTAFVFVAIFWTKKIARGTKNAVGRYAFINRLFNDSGFRWKVFSTIALCASVAYSMALLVFAVFGKSYWYAALAVYHLIFCVARLLVLLGERSAAKKLTNERDKQYKKARTYTTCGYLLIAVGLTLIFSVLEIVFRNGKFRYAGILIYVFAAMTFYKLIVAIVQIVRIKRQKDYTVRSIILGNLAWAAVSLLSLQTAMFDSFASVENVAPFNAMTGGGVCLFLVALGMITVVTGKKECKRLEKVYESNNE